MSAFLESGRARECSTFSELGKKSHDVEFAQNVEKSPLWENSYDDLTDVASCRIHHSCLSGI